MEILLIGNLLSVRVFFVRSPCRAPEIDPVPNGIEPLRSIGSAITDENGNKIPTRNTNVAAVIDTAVCSSFDSVICSL
jgi:hypothetical protein